MNSRLRVLQREKEKSDSKRSIEKLFTQLDRSFSGTALNIAASEALSDDVKDVRDAKISQLEATVSSLKSEKKDLELRLLSLETVQGIYKVNSGNWDDNKLYWFWFAEKKDSLDLEVSELHARLENVLKENSMLTTRLKHFHDLEGNNIKHT